MKDWMKICIPSGSRTLDALRVINDFSTRFAAVVDEKGKLMGCITDGDIRRALLKNMSMDSKVDQVMNPAPLVLSQGVRKTEALAFLKKNLITHVPLLNSAGIVTGVFSLEDFEPQGMRPNTAVLMVGGLGSRLGDLTSNCPKPLLKVGGRPVLEIIVENLKEHGFSEFIFCVNYRAEMITDHFGNGSAFGINIQYVREEKRMGTAGALTLLPGDTKGPLLVMNGDIVTKVNFSRMLDFHRENEAKATMGVRKFDFQIPFGVVKTNEGMIVGIEEKPLHSFLVSAGIYIIENEALAQIPANSFFDMPQLFESMISNHLKTQAFAIHEYWLDIGRETDLAQAQEDYGGDSH